MLSTVPRLFAAALFAVVFAAFLTLAIAPARSAETATVNDTARFLAGLPPAPDSPLAALAKSPEWAQHARFFDAIFAREDANTLSKVRTFSKEHLPQQHDTMLYMFSGPDFLYATSFFPSASTYVLAGLEPVGAVPQLTSLPRGAVDASLHNIEGSLASILNLSFFITKNMKTQLTAGPVYGTLPILYVFLARTGKTVHEVSLVNVDGQGNVVAAEEPGTKQRAATQSAAKGVKIVFSDGSGPRQTLYYFSTDLSDGGVKSSGFLEFCAKFGVADSFIKSASYLLHSGGFSRVRDSWSTAVPPFSKTTAAFRSPISMRSNGACSRSAIICTRWASFPTPISRTWRSCSARQPRSTSASAICGARTNRTSCWRHGRARGRARPKLTSC